MPRILQTDATEIIQPVIPRDAAGQPTGPILWNDPDLAVHWRLSDSVGWQPITLSAGTVGVWSSGGWVHIGDGVHLLGLPDEAIAPGDSTVIRLAYASHPPQFDTIDAVIPAAVDAQTIADDVIGGMSSSQLLMGGMAQFQAASDLFLIQGDTYTAARGTAWEKRIEQPGFDFTAGGLSVRFGAGNEPGMPLITGTASLVDAAVGSVTLRLEFSRGDTAAIANGSYHWDAELYQGTEFVATIDGGMLHLAASWTTLD